MCFILRQLLVFSLTPPIIEGSDVGKKLESHVSFNLDYKIMSLTDINIP